MQPLGVLGPEPSGSLIERSYSSRYWSGKTCAPAAASAVGKNRFTHGQSVPHLGKGRAGVKSLDSRPPPGAPLHSARGRPRPDRFRQHAPVAVYGFPVRHSASPAMQNAGIAALGLDWCYTAAEVRLSNSLKPFGAQAMHYVGLNLTVPHKLLALDMVEVLDESAREWGAVNAILFEAKPIRATGAPFMNLKPPRKTCAATASTPTPTASPKACAKISAWKCAAKASCSLAPAVPVVAPEDRRHRRQGTLSVNRTASKAEAIAPRFAIVSLRAGKCEYPRPKWISCSMPPPSASGRRPHPFDPAAFSLGKSRAVYDMVYRPPKPRCSPRRRSRLQNRQAWVLLHQGAKALEIWTGQSAPLEVMRRHWRRSMADFVVWLSSTLVLFSIIFSMFGCIVGSFLNVVIHRLPREMSVANPLSLPQCGYIIPWYQNIPLVIWLWQYGRCAGCDTHSRSLFPRRAPYRPRLMAHGFWCIIISRLVQKIHFLSNPS